MKKIIILILLSVQLHTQTVQTISHENIDFIKELDFWFLDESKSDSVKKHFYQYLNYLNVDKNLADYHINISFKFVLINEKNTLTQKILDLIYLDLLIRDGDPRIAEKKLFDISINTFPEEYRRNFDNLIISMKARLKQRLIKVGLTPSLDLKKSKIVDLKKYFFYTIEYGVKPIQTYELKKVSKENLELYVDMKFNDPGFMQFVSSNMGTIDLRIGFEYSFRYLHLIQIDDVKSPLSQQVFNESSNFYFNYSLQNNTNYNLFLKAGLDIFILNFNNAKQDKNEIKVKTKKITKLGFNVGVGFEYLISKYFSATTSYTHHLYGKNFEQTISGSHGYLSLSVNYHIY